MARNAPISVKDLTAALAIGKEQGKQESLVARRERPAENPPPGGNPGRPPWPGYPNPMPPGKDWPSASLRINPNTILLPREPAPAESDDGYGENPTPGHPDWQMAHGEHFDEYGRIIQDPGFGIDRGGNPIRLPHMEQSPEEQKHNKGLHDWKYHDGEDPGTFDKVMELAQELNPAQLKILKGIPADINSKSAGERLKIMRSITAGVRGAA